MLKVIGGAVVGPMAIFVAYSRRRRKDPDFQMPATEDLLKTIPIIMLAGVFAATAFSLQDVVSRRIDRGAHVPWPMRIAFGLGMISVIFVWVPVALVTIVAGLYFAMETGILVV